jgi:hypothetical protein
MADLTYTATLNDKITPALKRIESNVEKVNNKFSGLKSALAGLAIGATISNVIRLADSIQDVSDASGVAISNILGFQNAVALNGGSAEQAQASIYKLVQSIGEAADGGAKAQEAFSQVGVTLQDLSTLSEQDILAKTVAGLANINDAGQRAVLTTQLLGKGFRGINIQGVSDQLGAATQASAQYTRAVQQTAEMQGKLDVAFQRFQLAVLKAIQPLVELVNKLDDERVGNFIDVIVDLAAKIGALAAAIYVAEKAIVGMGRILALGGAAFLAYKTNIMGIILGFKSLGKTATIAYGYLDRFRRGTPMFDKQNGSIKNFATLIEKLIVRLPFLGNGIGFIVGRLFSLIPVVGATILAFQALSAAVKLFSGSSIGEWFDKGITKLKEFIGLQDKAKDTGPDQSDAETKRLQRQNDTLKAQADKVRDVTGSLDAKRKEIENITKAFKDQNNQTLQSIALEEKYIGVSADTAEILKAQDEIYKRQQTEIEKLRDAKALLTDKEKDLAAVYDLQIIKISVQAQKDAERVAAATSGLQSVRNAEAARLNLIEATNQQLEKQASIETSMRETVMSIQRSLEDVNLEGIANNYERGMAKIKLDTERAVADIRKQFEGMIDESTMDPAVVKQMNEALIAMEQKFYAVGKAREAAFMKDNPQTFAEGWKTAFDSYMDNATNAAQQAGQAFNSVTSNMNSAIDKFVETGKFSFGDFARSVIQDLIKIELKAQASKILSGVVSGAGSFLGSLFGGFFANGGQPPVGKVSVVGEKGPELFVPKTAGTIIPNGGNGMNGSVSNTYITNNISAVDAKSVAQLFAENRRTLFGTVEMARKELSYGR